MAQLNAKQPVNHNYGLGGSHSRSSSQPQFFSNNCLPPLCPLPHSESSLASRSSIKDVSKEEVDVSSRGPPPLVGSSYTFENAFRGNLDGLPPRKGHRRSNSDVPLGFNVMIKTSPQLVPISGQGALGQSCSRDNKFGLDKPILLQKQEMNTISDSKSHVEGIGDRISEGEVVDDLFRSYMNLGNTGRRNASSFGDKDKGNTFSSTKRSGGDSSNNEVDSVSKGNGSEIEGMCPREGIKRSAASDIAPTPTRHFRSLSVDSAFENLNFGDESPNLPPSGRNSTGQFSPSNSVNLGKFSLEFGNDEFSDAEVRKIMTDERLVEIAISDPKRAKRILANRQSAARSKERKLRYISELEHKVQTLQTEATTTSAQLTILQNDFTELTNQNNELKFRLKAMDQQSQLRDALHETLTGEVQRLKLAATELTGNGGSSGSTFQQIPVKHHHMLQTQRPSSSQHRQISVVASKTSTTASATSASA